MSPFASMASEKSLNRMVMVIAVAGLLLLAAQASSAADTGQPALSRRQMLTQIIGCMKKRMSASRTISYNEAAKACKEQPRQSDSPGPLVAADTPAKP
jgi:hypothetical protein